MTTKPQVPRHHTKLSNCFCFLATIFFSNIILENTSGLCFLLPKCLRWSASKLSTTKQPVPGCVPGAKTINHQATGSRMRTWRKNYQPPSNRFQDAYLAQKASTTKPPVPGCVPGAKSINHQATGSRTRTWRKKQQLLSTDCTFGHRRWHGDIIGTTTSLFETVPEGPELEG